MSVKVDEYGNKISNEDVRREVKSRKMPSIQDLFSADCAKRTAQATDVKSDADTTRDDLVVDANDNLGTFLKNQEKDNSTSQDASVLFDLSSDANDADSKFVSDQNKADKGNVTDTIVPAVDGRDELVADVAGDDKSGFESAQKSEAAKKKAASGEWDKRTKDEIKKDEEKARKDKDKKNKKKAGVAAADAAKKAADAAKKAADKVKDKKKGSLEKRVKARWSKLAASIMFDPFQLSGTKKKIVAFAIGGDYILMQSEKPTRSEWRTAVKVVSELRDPSIVRKASIVRKSQELEEISDVVDDVDDVVDVSEDVDGDVVIEETVAEEREEAAKLEDVLVDLEAGDVDAATAKVQECLSMKEEEIDEALEGDAGECEVDDLEGDIVDIVPMDEEIIGAEVVAKKSKVTAASTTCSGTLVFHNKKGGYLEFRGSGGEFGVGISEQDLMSLLEGKSINTTANLYMV